MKLTPSVVNTWKWFCFQVKCEAIKKEYGEQINGLQPLKITRPPKPEPAPPAPAKEEKKAAEPEVPAAPAPETAPMTSVSA